MLPEILPFPPILLIALVFFLSSLLLSLSYHKATKDDRKQPPGPMGWPVIGNLHMLGGLPHRSLQSLAKRYGPIMSLRLGQVSTVVISSPEAAELVLKAYDTIFANRPKTQASEHLFYGSTGLVFCEYGPYWRMVKKLCTSQLLSASKVEMFRPIRREEVGELVKSIEKSAAAREMVNLSEKVEEVIEDIMYRTILGRKKDDRFDLKGLVHVAMRLAGAFHAAEYVPLLGLFDIQGLTRRLKQHSKELDEMLETIIKEHEEALLDDGHYKTPQNDFVDILLSSMNSHDDDDNQQNDVVVLDRSNIKAILLDMIAGAVDPTVVILWAFSELLRNPRVMKQLQHELKTVIGLSKTKMVEETDLPRLSYLDMVIKETMRLHPVAPLLVPRVCVEDITINGYFIRKNSRIVVNVWAVGRDPKIWSDNVRMFCPERFVDCNIDLKGHNFELLPFGSGRRRCPGMLLGLTTAKLVLAQLVHCFNWELPNGISSDDLDMSEKFGLSMPRLHPLLVIPSYS